MTAHTIGHEPKYCPCCQDMKPAADFVGGSSGLCTGCTTEIEADHVAMAAATKEQAKQAPLDEPF